VKGRFDYVAYYDLDHTILNGNSANQLVEEARKRGIMTPSKYVHALYLSILYKLGIGDPVKMIERMLTWLNGLSEEAVISLCQDVFTVQLAHTIRPEVLASMKNHRDSSGAIVLLSSATSPICEPVRRFLQLDDVICTQLHSVDGILTGKTEGKLVYGVEKRRRLLEHCEAHEFDPAEAWYYGDSYTDLHVMQAVGNPVAVAPDKLLLRKARELQWAVLVPGR
jgi:putative phosphoserine phosphatase/1-acylglycerol-3-phosphate O-acyltransferase